MTTSGSPQILKGALVSIDASNPQPRIIPFQFNPDTLQRQITPQMMGGEEGQRSEEVHFIGAPVETITVEIELDATDALEKGDATALSYGIYPQLASLELLAYPSSSQVSSNASLLSSGTLEVVPLAAPRTLFIWGPQRVLPVRINSFTVTEEGYDAHLNPIRAAVSLNMRVLTYSDLSETTSGYHEYMAHQRLLETLASQVHSTASSLGVNITSNT